MVGGSGRRRVDLLQLELQRVHDAIEVRATSIVPAVKQIEVHPYFRQLDVQAAGAGHGILTQACSPIGGITFDRDGKNSRRLDDPTSPGSLPPTASRLHRPYCARMCSRAARRSPRPTNPSRIAENFDPQVSGSELAAIDALDTGIRGGPEPDAVTLEAFGRHFRGVFDRPLRGDAPRRCDRTFPIR